MPYTTCPQCHASFHTGLLYVDAESCPRCGARFQPARRNLRDQLRTAVFRHSARQEIVDWEAITSSQYSDRQYVSERRRKLKR